MAWNRLRGLVLGVGLGLALAAPPAAALSEMDVPLDHWSYEFADRLVIRAALGRTFLDLRPLTRGEMALLVQRLDTAARAGPWEPTSIEIQQLEMLRQEFSEELLEIGIDLSLDRQAYHVWGGDDWRLQAFWRGGSLVAAMHPDPAEPESQTDAWVLLQPAAALRLGDHVLGTVQVDYRWRTSTSSLVNSADVRGGQAEFVFEPRDRFSIVRSLEPQLRYHGRSWRLGLERGWVRWGPGRANAMLLLGASPPLDALRLQLGRGPVRFASMVAQLRPAHLEPTDPPLRERYLAAHRLEFATRSRLHLAVSEAIIWGDRGLDLSYCNPLAVFFVTQANNGDVDNALVSVDGSWRVARGLELHGECVVDDLNLRRGLRHFGNKLGVLAGGVWQEPLGARDWDLLAEWSWASQFTYTHHFPINRYEHYGVSLGSWTGPDSDLWTLAVRRRWSCGWSTRFFYELERHGEGSLATGDDQRTSDQQDFLSGLVESRHHPGVQATYQGLRSLRLEAAYRWLGVVHPAHDPARGRLESHEVSLGAWLEL
jgi:hypothetical protein